MFDVTPESTPRRSMVGWTASWAFSVAAFTLASTPSALAQLCNYGWCEGPPAYTCPQWCNTHRALQNVYYDPYDCGGGYCAQYICWYLNDDGGEGACSYPANVCDNSDVWQCY